MLIEAGGNNSILGGCVVLSGAGHTNATSSNQSLGLLHGTKLIVSDAHRGIAATPQAVFPSMPWQELPCHLQQKPESISVFVLPAEHQKHMRISIANGLVNQEDKCRSRVTAIFLNRNSFPCLITTLLFASKAISGPLIKSISPRSNSPYLIALFRKQLHGNKVLAQPESKFEKVHTFVVTS